MVRRIAGALVLTALTAALLMYPQQTAQGMKEGIELCLGRIVPSLFPMMLLCMLFVESGFAKAAGKWFAPVSSKLLGLPGEAASALLVSLIGGYPAGARAIASLYESGAITSAQAKKMSLFCFSAGPAFLIGVAGEIAGYSAAGWVLLCVQIVAVLIITAAVCFFDRVNNPVGAEADRCVKSAGNISDMVVTSVNKTASAILQVCLYVAVFSALSSLMEQVGLTKLLVAALKYIGVSDMAAEAVLPVLFEVTGGCVSAAGVGLPFMAFAVGFGGLSVQMQVLSIISETGVDHLRFVLFRVLQGIISAVLTWWVLELLPGDWAVAASADSSGAAISGSPQGAIMLVLMCAVFTLCLADRSDMGCRKIGC